MCGISGFCGKSYNPYILKLLNLFNETRGTDSIGIVVNNERTISLGFKSQENYGKALIFQQSFEYPNSKELANRTVLQHNRARSVGSINEDSVHPYIYEYIREVDKEERVYKFFFMHNGTLKDPHLLAKHYGKNYVDFHTDSHLLGALILEHGIEVLQMYSGAAACAFYWEHEPNTVYLWKGRSEQTTGYNAYATSYVAEERPLYFAQTQEGMYFASEKGFLVGSGLNTVMSLSSNSVVKFVNGNVVETTKLERTPIKEAPKPVSKVYSYNNDLADSGKVISIARKQDEHDPRSFIIDKIVYYKNRYYLNKKPCDGIYSVNPDYSIDADFVQGETHYFINGYWIKNKTVYERITKYNANNPDNKYEYKIQTDLNYDSLVYHLDGEKRKYYCNDQLVYKLKSGLIKPKFCYFYYQFDEKSDLIRTYHPAQAIEEGLLSAYQLYVEKFNFHRTDVKIEDYYYVGTQKECRDVAAMTGWELNFANLFDFPAYIIVNSKYELTTTEEAPTCEVDCREDIALREFNAQFKTDFKSRLEANDWYEKEKGTVYSKKWPSTKIPF